MDNRSTSVSVSDRAVMLAKSSMLTDQPQQSCRDCRAPSLWQEEISTYIRKFHHSNCPFTFTLPTDILLTLRESSTNSLQQDTKDTDTNITVQTLNVMIDDDNDVDSDHFMTVICRNHVIPPTNHYHSNYLLHR